MYDRRLGQNTEFQKIFYKVDIFYLFAGTLPFLCLLQFSVIIR